MLSWAEHGKSFITSGPGWLFKNVLARTLPLKRDFLQLKGLDRIHCKAVNCELHKWVKQCTREFITIDDATKDKTLVTGCKLVQVADSYTWEFSGLYFIHYVKKWITRAITHATMLIIFSAHASVSCYSCRFQSMQVISFNYQCKCFQQGC